MKRVVVAGGSGFLGQLLAHHFLTCGYEVVILRRAPMDSLGLLKQVCWDGRSLGDWTRELDGADVVVNLAGRSVNCRYHARNRRLILESRVNSTRVLGEAIAQCAQPPRVWLNASTATIYKHSIDRPMDEATGEIGSTPEANDAFSVEVARTWEQSLNEARTPNTHKIALRTAMVLGNGPNSVLPVLRRLVRFGLGGQMASGRQFVSWIHEVDFCRAIEWLIGRDDFTGPVNLAAPNPVPNREMMECLREVCHVSFGLPATQWMLELGAFFLRTETELIIKSRRVIPGRLMAAGFQFRFPHLRETLVDL
ncbi:MAG: TIGR01777 family oxidoreductase [Verrucomicrobiota bacterium]